MLCDKRCDVDAERCLLDEDECAALLRAAWAPPLNIILRVEELSKILQCPH